MEKIKTPYYLLNIKKLKHNLALLNRIQKEADVSILLSVKSFALWHVFPFIKKYISGAAASSLFEARLIFEEMNVKAHTYSVAFLEEDFEDVISYSSHITFNSLSEYYRHYPIVKKSKTKASVGLRINPEFSEVPYKMYNPCLPGSRFGEILENLPDELPENIEGLHIHALCMSGATDFVNVLSVFTKNFKKYFHKLKWINFGGGHLITGKDYDTELLISLLKKFKKDYNLQIFIEPGSAVTFRTGELIAQVLDIHNNKGIKTAILNTSFITHLPDVLEMPYKPEIRGASSIPQGKYIYRIGGNSCLSGDFAGDYGFDKKLKRGNILIFEDQMHYTMVKNNMFNGINLPAICIKNETGEIEIVKDFGYLDFRSRLG